VRLPLRVGLRAEAQIEEASDWWFEHRPDARGLFDGELERAFASIRQMPGIGQRVEYAPRPGVRRVYMARVRYHVYYVDAGDAIEILAVWHSARGSEPEL
jgi:plasmid stabilization system protein ParE